MDQTGVEKKLSIQYIICTVVGAIASITTGIAWGHWKHTLDRCIDYNCSCILYGVHTQTHFLGKSKQKTCKYFTLLLSSSTVLQPMVGCDALQDVLYYLIKIYYLSALLYIDVKFWETANAALRQTTKQLFSIRQLMEKGWNFK